MRFFATLCNDVRYQMKYGFYILYAFISVIYIMVLFVSPVEYRKSITSIIILTDPAMLGAFFIGGIWLLEKGEGLHDFWGVSPLKSIEYVLSKGVSLGIISTLAAAIIVFVGVGTEANYLMLLGSTFIGAMVFTLIGLLLASYARSVNHYMLVATLPLTILLTPPIVAAFGISTPILDLTPGMALWRLISQSIALSDTTNDGLFLVLFIWLIVVVILTNKRIPLAMQVEGDEQA